MNEAEKQAVRLLEVAWMSLEQAKASLRGQEFLPGEPPHDFIDLVSAIVNQAALVGVYVETRR